MSITYKIEIDNSKIENFPEFIEKSFRISNGIWESSCKKSS